MKVCLPCCEAVPVSAIEGTSAEDPVGAYKCNTMKHENVDNVYLPCCAVSISVGKETSVEDPLPTQTQYHESAAISSYLAVKQCLFLLLKGLQLRIQLSHINVYVIP